LHFYFISKGFLWLDLLLGGICNMVETQTISYSDEELTTREHDDFTRIHGIGPGIERRLHAAGILSYGQLAALQAQEIATAVGNLVGMSAQRVLDQEWIDQARRLLDTQIQPVERVLGSDTTDGRQHYAVFTVELLLDDENRVRRTRATHIQSQAEVAWAGWENHRLENFFIESSNLKIPQLPETDRLGRSPAKLELEQHTSDPLDDEERKLEYLTIETLEAEFPNNTVRSGQPFHIKLMLDLKNANRSVAEAISYSITVYAKKLGSTSRQIIGKAEGLLPPEDRVNLDVENINLSSGTYRLETLVTLLPTRRVNKPGSRLVAMTEGSWLQVY
jgi:hypothetical protein